MRRWVQNFDEVGFGIVFVVAEDAGLNFLARQCEGDHDYPAFYGPILCLVLRCSGHIIGCA